MASTPYTVRPGRGFPPGATFWPDGVNFTIFSRHATRASLVLFEDDLATQPLQIIELDPDENRSFFFWHVFVEGAGPGLQYAWRMDGPATTRQNGFRFDPDRLLLDPWSRCVNAIHWDRALTGRGEDLTTGIRGVVVAEDYDWEGDTPAHHPLQDSIIYELHVAGFTRGASATVVAPGTFRGLVEKIPYLQSLGITDVELMPVTAFDAQDVPHGVARRGLTNFWGYSPYAFFALHPAYATGADVRREFRDMVKALHRANIGVILDVVFNHTAEGGTGGPIINFKGLANEVYYHLDPDDRRLYRDYTGCGNTVNCNHPIVAQLLQQCAEYWVREMHVDGLRFDLASVLARGEDGETMHHAPVVWNIEFSPQLAQTKLIAEAWDATGVSQLGNFPGFRWAEWNGDYRDVIRRFVRGEAGIIDRVASRMTGSSDLFAARGAQPVNGINFITCHDGFTLYDLVSYNQKDNEANGEENRDGIDENHSWNCGHEGPTDDPEIVLLRRRQARNFLTILLLSHGVPMLLAGDEMLRSQKGNNNAYCQDNELSWIDWSLMDSNVDIVRFTREAIALRKRHPALCRTRFLTGKPGNGDPEMPDTTWHGATLAPPQWSDPDARILAFTLAPAVPDEEALHVVMNMADKQSKRSLPALPGRSWYRAIDTARGTPDDITPRAEQRRVRARSYTVQARSVVVFEARSASRRPSVRE
jgi:isoamylase